MIQGSPSQPPENGDGGGVGGVIFFLVCWVLSSRRLIILEWLGALLFLLETRLFLVSLVDEHEKITSELVKRRVE